MLRHTKLERAAVVHDGCGVPPPEPSVAVATRSQSSSVLYLFQLVVGLKTLTPVN
jgi:hypothetical protein